MLHAIRLMSTQKAGDCRHERFSGKRSHTLVLPVVFLKVEGLPTTLHESFALSG